MEPTETDALSGQSKKSGSVLKRARRRVKKAAKSAGLGGRRPSTNPVSLAAAQALSATRKQLKLGVSV